MSFMEKTLDNIIMLLEIKIHDDYLLLNFNRSDFHVWFENTNKHILEVYELTKVDSNNFIFYFSELSMNSTQSNLKLSLSNDVDRLNYSINNQISGCLLRDDIKVIFEKNINIFMCLINKNKNFISCENHIFKYVDCKIIENNTKLFKQVDKKNVPIKIGVIGTCFSRSVFRSDNYFNPEYKKYFTVPLTLFHSSFISLMSRKVVDQGDVFANDLLFDQVFRYIEVEFRKNIEDRVIASEIEYLVIDNYSDAVHKVVEMNDDDFLTYNRYFAESIYKRKFSGKDILTPGEISHITKYRAAVKIFYRMLQKLNLDKKIILVGCRLSSFKTPTELWQSKMDWINRVNSNLDIYDSIFLEELPNAQYIDMRSTSWISDVDTPIIGGASPSHYQSGLYKEIYERIKNIIFKD